MSRTLSLTLALLAALLLGSAAAQNARDAALAGTVIPHTNSGHNPATLALPDAPLALELPLPSGALHYLTSDWADPGNGSFDPLATLTQAASLDLYLLNPPRSPSDFTIRLSDDGLDISGDDQPLNIPNLALAQRLDLPIRFRVAPTTQLGIRPYAHASARSTHHLDLGVTTTSHDTSYALDLDLTTRAEANTGIALEAAYAHPLPPTATLEQQAFGVRAAALVGLAYARFDADARVLPEISEAAVEALAVLTVAGLPAGGVGLGASLDLGWAATLMHEGAPIALSLHLENLGLMLWPAEQHHYDLDSLNGGEASAPAAAPLLRMTPFKVLAAGSVHLDALFDTPAGHDLIAGLNLGYDSLSGVIATTALEWRTPNALTLRAGAGYHHGARAGLGVGYDLGPVGIDTALSARQGALGHPILGIAASLRLNLQ